jgi:hypothetical protein
METSIDQRVDDVIEAMLVSSPHWTGIADNGSDLIDDLDRLMNTPDAVEKTTHELALAHATMNRFIKRLKKL